MSEQAKALAELRELRDDPDIAGIPDYAAALDYAIDALSAPAQGEADSVRRSIDGSLDEITGSGPYHLERMGRSHWSLRLGRHLVGLVGGSGIVANFVENDLPATPPAPSAADAVPAGHHQVIRFGQGGVAVSTGAQDGEATVFLREPPEPGTVGAELPHDYAEMPLRVAMRFPTTEQAKAVANALVPTATPTEDKGGAWPDDAALRKLANLHGTRSYAMNGQTGVEHQGWSFRPEQLASFAAALTAAAPQGGE